MFVRRVTLTQKRKKHVYIEIFEDEARCRKKAEPLARLGPVDRLAGKLDDVVKGLREFCREKYVRAEEISVGAIRCWGPVMVTRHLWDEVGLGEMISGCCGADVAEAAFALTAMRLIDPTYDHGMDKWLETNSLTGGNGGGLDLDRLPGRAGSAGAPSASLWDAILHKMAGKRHAVERRFLETVKPFWGEGSEAFLYEVGGSFVEGASSRRRPGGWPGRSRRRNIRLFLGAIVCGDCPVNFRFFGGSEPNVAQIKRFAEESCRRLGFRKLIVILPSGTDEEKLCELSSLGLRYLVGVRRRRDPRALEAVREAGERWTKIASNVKVQEVLLPVESDAAIFGEPGEGVPAERYFLVHSAEEEKEERSFRLAVVGRALRALEQLKGAVDAGRLKKPATILARAERILAERKAYRYISWRMTSEGHLLYWEDKAKSAMRRDYEGISLLKTSDPEVSPSVAVLAYVGLDWLDAVYGRIYDTVAFRSALLPLPELEETPGKGMSGNLFIGHLLVNWFAFLLRWRLQKRLLENKIGLSLEDATEALRTISIVELGVGGDRHAVVSPGNSMAQKILRAVGIEASLPRTRLTPGES